MRFRAPARDAVDPACFDTPMFADYRPWHDLLRSPGWPSIDALDARWPAGDAGDRPRFVAQTPALLADAMHYERRIADTGRIACRAGNWHDLLNALVWLRHPALKRALNRRQAADAARFGSTRSRAQCALTHFDEAGVVLVLDDPRRLEAWDAHDWPGMFLGLPPGGFAVAVVGHALLEHALVADALLCGKAIAVLDRSPPRRLEHWLDAIAGGIACGRLLRDPQELRPLPLMGLPGWHPRAGEREFLADAPCFRPRRAGRCYPPPLGHDAVRDPPAGDPAASPLPSGERAAS